MPAPLHVIILAAGQGTRMKSARPKVLHEIAGRAMLGHVIDAAQQLAPAGIHVVVGHGGEMVRAWARDHVAGVPLHWAEQAEQLGTAHAVQQAMPQIPDAAQVLILYGDVPLVRAATLAALIEAGRRTLALLTVELTDPAGYGRILRNRGRAITAIVEDKDATARQRAIREVNTGLMSVPAKRLRGWLARVKNRNAKGEYYLTDIVGMAVKAGLKVVAASAVPDEVEGANDRAQLARLERLYQARQASALLADGLALADPARFDLRGQLTHGRDVFVDVGCVLEGTVVLGEGVHIGPYCVLRDVTLGAGTRVHAHSVLEGCTAGADCVIGPFARVRPTTQLADGSHVGNFVEIKNAQLGAGTKANHLAYVGDATIGSRTNIGAGVITCNYDGANKHRTTIGDDVFVGSDTQLVAPVAVGDGATIGAGSTITRDVPGGGLTIARAREQKTLASWKRPRKGAG
ncbi:bifunctional UDP-N-acetylglucosamine diphosphorylase/glucosamine-1-phosphate N-acetyltransferase GlmU [Solimonas variicoloris]|uniref:bifunctional UDP-N-acetylglucosamine diphosphorylase/glucosamine-1-phosphate N-acetyltransferase GlmU n=1 Tax=Solimonas variicoloris TaxID=254408 RepID=UPI00037A6252|nr:bifunctional UDP-N-acetylglucosamine diphosphorylase/glucosamine-1-phosphate N-acetyltransferase GlmU [Solimonas variicoloris]